MPSSLDTTAGGTNANSYVSLEEANTYFDDRPNSSRWTAATDNQKKQALLFATKLIDATVRFTGSKVSSTQALEWPRTGMLDRNGNSLSSSVIPTLLKNIVCEIALTTLASDRMAELDASVQGLTSLRAGPVTLSFKDTIPAPKAVADTIYNMFVFSWIWRQVPGPVLV